MDSNINISGEVKFVLENIKSTRVSLGMSQDTVAKHLLISQNAYSRIERGAGRMRVEQFFVLCQLFNADPCDLLTIPRIKQFVAS